MFEVSLFPFDLHCLDFFFKLQPDHQAERSTEEGEVERKAGQMLSQTCLSHYGHLMVR